MTKNRCSPVTLFLGIGAFLICAATAQAVAAAGPVSSHVTASVRSVQPAVSGLFQVHTPRVWADARDAAGEPGANGVPDFLDSWQAFRSSVASAILNNAYAFRTIDGQGDEILYAGVNRASSGGPSKVVMEFNQKPGERLVGDLRIDAEIDSDGNVGTARFESYAGEAKGSAKFLSLAILSGEGCNDAGTACIVSNGALLEVGVNLSRLLNESRKSFTGIQITTPENYAAGTIRPMASSGTADCVTEQGGFNKANCTANDVRLTSIVEGSQVITSGTGCTSDKTCFTAAGLNTGTVCTGTPGTQGSCVATQTCYATVTFHATGNYVVGPQRYDIGLYIATDTDPNNDGARTGDCDRFAFPIGTVGTVDLDADQCADVAAGSTPAVPFTDVTIPCIDKTGPAGVPDGLVDINHCETWANSTDGVCTGNLDVKAQTSSKCFCGLLAGACIAIDDNNPCTTDVCRGTCQPASGTGGSGTTCIDNTQCTAPETCRGITLHHDNVPNGTVCGPDPDETNPCDVAKTCQVGTNGVSTCTGTGFADNTVQCRASVCDTTSSSCCDVPEFCTGSSAVCPADGFKTSAVQCRASGGVCDIAEFCTGTSNACPSDAKSTAECRASAGFCDVPESCNGVDNDCPPDLFKASTVECRASSCDITLASCCDVPENCTGSSAACPADGFAPATKVCRAATLICDVEEKCTGSSATCPVDAVVTAASHTVCRASDGSPCDPPEECNGTDKTCPTDLCAGGAKDLTLPDSCTPAGSALIKASPRK